MEYRCELKERDAQPSLSIRTQVAVQDLPSVFPKTFGALMGYLGELGEQPTGMPYSAYYNMDMQDLDVEIGVPVARELPGRGEVTPSELPGGKQASVIHTGPYDQLGPAYEALIGWVKEQGYEPSGVFYEFYYSGPETPPEQIKTEIVAPLRST